MREVFEIGVDLVVELLTVEKSLVHRLLEKGPFWRFMVNGVIKMLLLAFSPAFLTAGLLAIFRHLNIALWSEKMVCITILLEIGLWFLMG